MWVTESCLFSSQLEVWQQVPWTTGMPPDPEQFERTVAKNYTNARCIRVEVEGVALPWTAWVAKVDRQSGVNLKFGVLGHLCTLAPGQ